MTTTSAPQLHTREGVWARVDIHVKVQPHARRKDDVIGKVTIAATNRTADPIHLTEPYHLPVRRAVKVSACIENGPRLDAYAKGSKIYVFFDDHIIEPNATLTWCVEYTRTSDHYFDHILGYELFIDPQQELQGVPVRKHVFHLTVDLETPDDARWRAAETWRLHQRNSLDVNPTVTRNASRTTYRYEFDTITEPFDLRISAVYSFKSVVAGAFHTAVTVAVLLFIEHGLADIISVIGERIGLLRRSH